MISLVGLVAPFAFHLGWAAILAALLLLALLPSGQDRDGTPRRPSLLLQVCLCLAVTAWAGVSLGTVAGDHGPGLEVMGYTLEPPRSGPAAMSLGTGESADVVLADAWADDVHAVVRWHAGTSGHEPWIWNASASRKLLIDGRDVHETELEPGSRLLLGDGAIEVVEVGGWPRVDLRTSDGGTVTLPAPPLRGLLALVPVLGRGIRTHLGYLGRDDRGRPVVSTGPLPLPGTGPVAMLVLRGRTPVLAFGGASERAMHPVRVAAPGAEPVRPADRWTRLRDGQTLGMGYSRFSVSVERGGRVVLRAMGEPARLPWPDEGSSVLGSAPGLLATGLAGGTALRLASLGPEEERGFRSVGGVLVEGEGGRPGVEVGAGGLVEIPAAPGARVLLRVAGRSGPKEALAGLASQGERDVWRAFVVLGGLYLLLAAAASRAGLLHARSSGVLHGAALLFAVGLLCLYRLSDPGDVRRAGWVIRQARLGAVGLGGAALVAGVLAWRARRVAPSPGSLFRWLDGRNSEGSRARWLYLVAVAVLALQLPFGETGISVPGLGSIQPIEAARTLLVVYLAYWTARSVESKRDRLRGSEGLAQRWGYFVHALPVLVVLCLCYGLHDISPILVFVAFLAVLYLASLLRPSVRLWPPRAWADHFLIEPVAAAGLLCAACWLVLADPQGTVATRLRTWWDPWSHSSDAYQAVTALWATAQGGLFGLGWTGANGVLPPAVKDDFILALLAARAGGVAVVLVAGTFGTMLVSGALSLGSPGALARSSGERERATMLASAVLWMLAIQATVVLGSATGGLPVMGQPLPFVAAAGSHLLLFCVPATGLVLGCARVRVPCDAHLPIAWRPRRPQVAPGWEGIPVQPITEGGA